MEVRYMISNAPEVLKLKEQLMQGGGTAKVEEQHGAGKLTARERIEKVIDKDTFVEIDVFLKFRETQYAPDCAPGEGVIAGFGTINQRPVYIYAQDYTVLDGSFGEMHAKKICKVQEMAMKNGAPIIGINDSGGARIQEGVASLGGYADVFQQNILVYIAYLMVPIAWFVLGKTTLGLKIRAVGENPEAADTLGVSVSGVRYITQIFGGVMSGIAGASLSIALLNVFQQNLTSGLGFIAVALVYFGGWRPFGVLVGALIFSMVIALSNWVQVLNIPIPSDVAVMLPYVLTILALIIAVQRVRPPSALTKPYDRGG